MPKRRHVREHWNCESCGVSLAGTKFVRWCGKPECREAARQNKLQTTARIKSEMIRDGRRKKTNKKYKCQRCGVLISNENRMHCSMCAKLLAHTYSDDAIGFGWI